MRARHLVIAAATIAITSYLIRIAVPFGKEYQHLALGQAGAWVTGFVLGVLGAERGWFEHMTPATARRMFRIAWSGAALLVFLVAMTAAVHGGDLDPLFGGGSWHCSKCWSRARWLSRCRSGSTTPSGGTSPVSAG